jgi:hypothetical protein
LPEWELDIINSNFNIISKDSEIYELDNDEFKNIQSKFKNGLEQEIIKKAKNDEDFKRKAVN